MSYLVDCIPFLLGLAGLAFARWGSRIDSDAIERTENRARQRVESLFGKGASW